MMTNVVWPRTMQAIESEAGAEKPCRACGEYWPMDAEFFAVAPLRSDGLSVRCRACISEKFWGYRTLYPAPPYRHGD